MKRFVSSFFFLAALLRLSTERQEKNYVAAVVEYFPFQDTNRNIESYNFITAAAARDHSADIVIFPESTLTVQKQWATIVPHPKENVIPYKNSTFKTFKVMHEMSKTAAETKSYVVINVLERENCTKGEGACPERGYFLYNTNVAFDRDGMVVARYRKVNVYDENADRPKGEQLSTFTTDFGVTFGLITCFDILFKTPGIDLVEKKIKNIIFTNFWYGELPFLTASQIQGGWSYATNVTLFAAGANNPPGGTTGTGIYFGRKSFVSRMFETPGTMYIVWNMSNTPGSSVHLPYKNEATEPRSLNLLQDPSLPWAKNVTLDFGRSQFKETICHNGLCCKFDVDYETLIANNTDGYTYKAVAFQGERPFGKSFRHEVAYCAVVLCINGNCAGKPSNDNFPLLFNKMEIQGEFKTANTIQIPSTLTWKSLQNGVRLLHLMDYDSFGFERRESGKGNSLVSMQLKKKYVNNLMVFGIFGRKFD